MYINAKVISTESVSGIRGGDLQLRGLIQVL
jgi:hypothetical protein